MMDLLVPLLFPAICFSISAVILAGALWQWRRKIAKRNRRSPLTRSMLRAPGESLKTEIENLEFENSYWLIMTFLAPFLLFSSYVSRLYFLSKSANAFDFAFLLLMIGIILFFMIRKVFRNIEKLRRKQLGMEGEIATGEELNQLMLDGCRVFHDIPFEYGNIDHVVVSTSGVFSVETKTHAKSNQSGSEKVTIDFNNDTVRFSDWTWKIPAKQLETNSRWLSQYLSNSTGMKVESEAMLALPGYFIEERIGKGNVFVFNPKQPKKFFLNSRSVLTAQQIQQIAHQLEQLCRDVKPSFGYKKETK